jgi:SAM-dependent methyltransferase
MLRELLVPAAKAVETLPANPPETEGAKRLGISSGWDVDTLLPYLMRDWTNTAELHASYSIISAALKHAFPDPSGKSVVFAGCGAGGLLAEIATDFERVLGFDLTFPVLAAARRLLDGEVIELALPHAITELRRLRLSRRDPAASASHVEVLAMDALNTAFADGSIDCVVTSFLTDLMPDPYKLADEIRRVLSPNGIWINYGPSGALKSVWRFDQLETAAFFETAGFEVIESNAHRTTNLDLSRDCPTWSFRSHICYLTSARKIADAGRKPKRPTPTSTEIVNLIPLHFPGATLVERQSLDVHRPRTTIFRHEAIPGRMQSFEVGGDAIRMITLVDGKRTVREIAELLEKSVPPRTVEETIHVFSRYFNDGLLNWSEGAG